jgi:hypothetical protein
MGAILTQVDKQGKFYVIAYASKKIEKHEKNYTPFLLEMYAAVWGMDHFSHHLRGKRFLLFTDHKPLEKLGKVHTKTLYRIQEAMLNYDFEIHYRKGEDMPADYLSRNILAISDDTLMLQQQQETDEQLSVIIQFLKFGKIPPTKEGKKLVTRYASRCYLEHDLLYIRFFDPTVGHRSLICVPNNMKEKLCQQYHTSWYGGHGGTLKTKQRLLTRYFWPNMEKDIEKEITNCHQCQIRNKDTKPKAMLKPLPLLSRPNQRIHADLFGPLKTSEKGKKFILVITDAFTKYVELVATINKEADTIAEQLFLNWICRYGIPAELITDQGKEFTAQVCEKLWNKLDVIHSTTSPRHPQCNSQAEVVNKTIAKYLAAFVDESTLDWEAYLAPLMFYYNTSYHRSIKTSPFFLTYGVEANLPKDFDIDYNSDISTDLMSRLQLARHLAKQNIEEQSRIAKEQYDKKVKQYIFQPKQEVLLDEYYFLNKNQKLAPKYSGPHIITKLKGDCNVELLLNNGKFAIVHVNRLKPYIRKENAGQNFSKQEKDGEDEQDEEDESFEVGQGRNQQTGYQHLEQNENEVREGKIQNEPQIAQENIGQRAQANTPQRMTTRGLARKEGMVYNEETKTFEHLSPLEAIEALRKKTRKPIIYRRIKHDPNHVLIEDVVYQVKPNYEPSQIKTEKEEDWPEEETYYSDTETPSTPEKPKPDLTRKASQHNLTPAKQVNFPPEYHTQVYQFPLDPDTGKASPKPTITSYTKQILRETADALFPPIKNPVTYQEDERPIRGARQSYAQMFPPSPSPNDFKPIRTSFTETRRELREEAPPPVQQRPLPELPVTPPTIDREGGERTGPAAGTRSQHRDPPPGPQS